jgi:hypothetical protein
MAEETKCRCFTVSLPDGTAKDVMAHGYDVDAEGALVLHEPTGSPCGARRHVASFKPGKWSGVCGAPVAEEARLPIQAPEGRTIVQPTTFLRLKEGRLQQKWQTFKFTDGVGVSDLVEDWRAVPEAGEGE